MRFLLQRHIQLPFVLHTITIFHLHDSPLLQTMEVPDSACEDFAPTAPFPNDVPTAPSPRISPNKLLNKDQDEPGHFFTAHQDSGFLYLDLRGALQGQSMLDNADKLFDVGKQLYDLTFGRKAEIQPQRSKVIHTRGKPSSHQRPCSGQARMDEEQLQRLPHLRH